MADEFLNQDVIDEIGVFACGDSHSIATFRGVSRAFNKAATLAMCHFTAGSVSNVPLFLSAAANGRGDRNEAERVLLLLAFMHPPSMRRVDHDVAARVLLQLLRHSNALLAARGEFDIATDISELELCDGAEVVPQLESLAAAAAFSGLRVLGRTAFSSSLTCLGLRFGHRATFVGVLDLSNCHRLGELPDACLDGATIVRGLLLPAGLEGVGEYAFARLQLDTGSLRLPSSIKRVGRGCFSHAHISKIDLTECASLTSLPPHFCRAALVRKAVLLPPSLQVVGDLAFSRISVPQVVFPPSVTALGSGVLAESRITGDVDLSECRFLEALPPKFCQRAKVDGAVLLPDSLLALRHDDFAELHAGVLVLPADLQHVEGSVLERATVRQLDLGRCSRLTRLAASFCNHATVLANVVMPPNLSSISDWCMCSLTSRAQLVFPASLAAAGAGFLANSVLSVLDLSGCGELTYLPDAFCRGATIGERICLPPGCTHIGENAFRDATIAGDLVFPATVEHMGIAVAQQAAIHGDLDLRPCSDLQTLPKRFARLAVIGGAKRLPAHLDRDSDASSATLERQESDDRTSARCE